MFNLLKKFTKWDHRVLPWKSASSLLMNRVYSPARVLKAFAGEEQAGKSLNVTSGRFEDLILLSMLFCFRFFTICLPYPAMCRTRGAVQVAVLSLSPNLPGFKQNCEFSSLLPSAYAAPPHLRRSCGRHCLEFPRNLATGL